ncbi:MAG: hypothetical protein JW791_04925 [Nanoarchaeota archaeon]|nr:hypothetical protein [Nanoarchaeota archaeon]
MLDVPDLIADVGIKQERIPNIEHLYLLIHENTAIIRDDLVKLLEMPRTTVYDMIKVLFDKNLINKLSVPKPGRGRPLIYFSTVEDVLFKPYKKGADSCDAYLNTILKVCSTDALKLEQIKESTNISVDKILSYLPNTCFIKRTKQLINDNPLCIVVPENIMDLINV